MNFPVNIAVFSARIVEPRKLLAAVKCPVFLRIRNVSSSYLWLLRSTLHIQKLKILCFDVWRRQWNLSESSNQLVNNVILEVPFGHPRDRRRLRYCSASVHHWELRTFEILSRSFSFHQIWRQLITLLFWKHPLGFYWSSLWGIIGRPRCSLHSLDSDMCS
jgi:hypothetical protein